MDAWPILKRAGVVAYRPLADDEVEILLITSRKYPERWIFPMGVVDRGETLQQAAARECAEESGYTVEVGHQLEIPEPDKGEPINHMTFFLARVTGKRATYETDRQRRWVRPAELVDTVAEDFKPIAQVAAKELGG